MRSGVFILVLLGWLGVSIGATQNSISTCTVSDGSKPDCDAILISGALAVSEAALIQAGQITLEIDCATLPAPLEYSLPVTSSNYKRGKYTGTIKQGPSPISLSFDSKTGKFSFSAKNINLAGLSCPFDFQVTAGVFSTTFTLQESVVNGAKPCPASLMMGFANSLELTKFQWKQGTTANSDTLSAQGTFGVLGNFSFAEPFVLSLGDQTFTIPGTAFKTAKGITSCNNAAIAEGGLASIKLDGVTCAFSIALKNISVSAYGTVPFDLNLFGIALVGFETRDLGAKTAFNILKLTGYDRRGVRWDYHSSYTATILDEDPVSGTADGSINVEDFQQNVMGRLCNVITSSVGGSEMSMARYTDSTGTYAAEWGSFTDIGGFTADFSSDFQYAPITLRIGQTFSDKGTFTGTYDLQSTEAEITDFHGSANGSFALLGREMISVPYGDYDSVKGQQNLSLSGQMRMVIDTTDPWTDQRFYYNKIVKFTADCKQTFWASEEIGFLKQITTLSMKITLPGYGSIPVTMTDASELTGYSE
jgi:hypothetical protein